MQIVLITIHLLLALGMIGLVLLQKAEGSGLAGLSGGGSGGGFLSARGAANLLTRTTAILAALFMGTSLILNILVARDVKKSILTQPAVAQVQPVDKKPEIPHSIPQNINNTSQTPGNSNAITPSKQKPS